MRDFARLLALLGPHRARLILTVLCGVLAQACALGAAAMAGLLVGSALTGAHTANLVPAVAALITCALGQGVAAWLESWFSHDYAFRVIAELRTVLVAALDRLAPGWLLGQRTGDIGAIVMSDVERTEWLYAHVLPQSIVAVVVPLAGLTALATLDVRLALVAGVAAVLLASIPTWLSIRAYRDGLALRSGQGALHADVVDGVQGLRELLLFGAADRHIERLDARMRDLLGARLRHGRRAGLENAVSESTQAGAVAGVLGIAGVLVGAGTLPLSVFALVVVLTSAVIAPIAVVTASAGQVGELRACARRILAVLDAQPSVAEYPAARVPREPIEPVVEFCDVSFRYHQDSPEVLRGIDIRVAAGETIALVGSSGAGKTTCASLVQRFWDPTEGSVRIGGRDLRELPVDVLRATVSIVPQDVHLFGVSMADNIRLGRPEATDAEVVRAAEAAQIADFIDTLPDGYATVLTERGLSLSGGQRQRLAIARALLVDPPVLVMDEAAADLDTQTERALHAAMGAESAAVRGRRRTTLVISHRLSSIMLADRVVVLDNGRIAEVGPPQQLLARGGIFTRLVANQSSITAS